MSTTQRPPPQYRNPKISGFEQARLASVAAADGVGRIETLLSDTGDDTIKAMISLLKRIAENQLAAERRQRRTEQAMGIILRHLGLPLPPGLEPIPPGPKPAPPSQSPRKP